jgi:hypothetical protein
MPIGDDIGRVKIPRWLEQYAEESSSSPMSRTRFPRRPGAVPAGRPVRIVHE